MKSTLKTLAGMFFLVAMFFMVAQTAGASIANAPDPLLLDLKFGQAGVSDASAYHSPVTINAAYASAEALGGYAFYLKDYNDISVTRDALQMFDHEQLSYSVNFRRAYPTSLGGEIAHLHTAMDFGVSTYGQAYFHITNASGTSYSLAATGAYIRDTKWHNLTISYDSVGLVARLYVDGVKVAETAVSGRTKPKEYWGLSISNPWGGNFNGFISDFEMRREAITDSGALSRYQALMQRVNSSVDTYQAPTYIGQSDLAEIPGAGLSANFTVSSAAELSSALASAKAGNVIMLNSGNYGSLAISGKYPGAYISIVAAPGAAPVFTDVKVADSSHILLRGFQVRPDSCKTAVSINGDHIVYEDSYITFADSTVGWTAADWVAKTCDGISLNGVKNVVRNNRMKNIAFGIQSSAAYSLVQGNLVESFRGDGMRGLGDYTIFENNTVENCYAVDANHDDGFQSWSVGPGGVVGTGVVTGVILRGNTILNNVDPNQPLLGPLQGIGMFDGPYDDWIIENNIVVVDHWHGISVYGGNNTVIKNNTVVDINNVTPGPSWTGFANHKNGTPPTNGLVKNNLVTALFGSGIAGVSFENNKIIKYADYPAYFVDPAHLDFRLRPDAPISGIGATRDGSYVPPAAKTVRADVDQNGRIEASDALLVLRKSLGLTTGASWYNSATTGDVNCDGAINSADAMLVLRYSVGLSMSGTAWCEGR